MKIHQFVLFVFIGMLSSVASAEIVTVEFNVFLEPPLDENGDPISGPDQFAYGGFTVNTDTPESMDIGNFLGAATDLYLFADNGDELFLSNGDVFVGTTAYSEEIGVYFQDVLLGPNFDLQLMPSAGVDFSNSLDIFLLGAADPSLIDLWSSFGSYQLDADEVYFLLDDLTITVSEVPIPATVWLFGSGLIGLIGIARQKKA